MATPESRPDAFNHKLLTKYCCLSAITIIVFFVLMQSARFNCPHSLLEKYKKLFPATKLYASTTGSLRMNTIV